MNILEILSDINFYYLIGAFASLSFIGFILVLLKKDVTPYQIIITSILLLVVGSVSYMSVYGLTAVFSEAFWAVLALGIGMELGKVVLVVSLHRRWSELRRIGKLSYMVVIFVLVLITTTELLGFLAQSHTAASTEVSTLDVKIKSLENKERLLTSQLSKYDAILNGLPETYVSLRLKKQKELRYQDKENELLSIQDRLSDFKSRSVIERTQAGPIFSAARMANIPDSKTIFWFIILIVVVVEPFSIGLTVATSDAWSVKKKVNDDNEKCKACLGSPVVSPPTYEPVDESIESIDKLADESINIIKPAIDKPVAEPIKFETDIPGHHAMAKSLHDEIISRDESPDFPWNQRIASKEESADKAEALKKDEIIVNPDAVVKGKIVKNFKDDIEDKPKIHKSGMTLKEEKLAIDTGEKPEKPAWKKEHDLFGKKSFKSKKKESDNDKS